MESNSSASKKEPVIPFDRYSLNGQSEELAKKVVEQVPILGDLALKGQSTIWFAAPNSGKTLLALHLLINAVISGVIDPVKVYYLNMDDSGQGLLEKVLLAEEYGFKMLAEGHHDFKAQDFINVINELVEKDSCRDVVVILDTLKKFTDVMDKGRASQFFKAIRKYVLKGGTFLALAHTNKKPDSSGKPIFGGTSDIVDDCDCAYTLAQVNANNDSSHKIVEFCNIKRRGTVANTAAYRYSIEEGISYGQLLASVVAVDNKQLNSFKKAEAIKADADIIKIIKACILDGINTKMKLADAAAERLGISKRAALEVIERYTGDDVAIHQWQFEVREHGAKVFALLNRSSTQADEDDSMY